jgi:hypothetical protein
MVDKVDVDKVDQGSLEWIVQSFAPRVLLLKPASGTSLFFLNHRIRITQSGRGTRPSQLLAQQSGFRAEWW